MKVGKIKKKNDFDDYFVVSENREAHIPYDLTIYYVICFNDFKSLIILKATCV